MFKTDHAAIAVSSLAVSRDFYVDLLGARVVSKPSAQFVEVMVGDLRLHLVATAGPRRSGAGPGLDHLCLNVATLAELAALRDALNAHPLFAANGPLELQDSPPFGDGLDGHCEQRPPLKTLYFTDPDGTGLEVRCYQ